MAMACVEDTNDNGNGILSNVEWDWIGWMNEWKDLVWLVAGSEMKELTDEWNGWMAVWVSERSDWESLELEFLTS